MGILAQWMEQVWNQSNRAAIDDLAAADCTVRSLQGDISGTAAWRTLWPRWGLCSGYED